ncbi:MAG: hypothetical protein KME25_17500 [Symplocastrum torsivum CPER-KK1]|uniref:Uncharacterized protein n=1 Tax=Symplocastrum torsivum CPER-KK1 TaxID=450513 RepID=A0A951PLQ0_9CYAN|nr:hypothetical protein [Symplocastrum torsivum CPER-KK1]
MLRLRRIFPVVSQNWGALAEGFIEGEKKRSPTSLTPRVRSHLTGTRSAIATVRALLHRYRAIALPSQ